jgi:NAD(P)-dependent dehydrogenase (short-subunit alcohol dehydrogenase family)
MSTLDVSSHSLSELVGLTERVAVVTGGARGIGFAIACRLAEAGANVAVADLDKVAAEQAAIHLGETYGRKAIGAQVDVSDEHSVSELADRVVAELGGLQIWVNNAGIYPVTPLFDITEEQWDRVLGTNLKGTFFGAREAAKRMKERRVSGVIINLSSTVGYRATSNGWADYGAAKHGVRGLTKTLAVQLGQFGIRVLALAPTGTDTPGIRRANTEAKALGVATEEAEQRAIRPLGRDGVPDDIARVALFCASDLSILMTGSTLLVDGGTLALL